MFSATLLTLVPEMVPGPLGLSLAGDAFQRGLWSLETLNIRAHGLGRHRAVDDTPAGGGPGMVMRADVLAASLDAEVKTDDPRPRLIMSPRGEPLTQAHVKQWAMGPGLIIVCPRFEGVDERVIEARNLIEISIGDYILSGGEVAALAVLEATTRLVPGVMGNATSATEESFSPSSGGLLEYPQYTRPAVFHGWEVPAVLRSGDHALVARWRRAQALARTRDRRPDLWAARGGATSEEAALLAEFDLG